MPSPYSSLVVKLHNPSPKQISLTLYSVFKNIHRVPPLPQQLLDGVIIGNLPRGVVPEAIGHDLHFDFGVGPVAACGVVVGFKEVEGAGLGFFVGRDGVRYCGERRCR
jgi:hypothetical protein